MTYLTLRQSAFSLVILTNFDPGLNQFLFNIHLGLPEFLQHLTRLLTLGQGLQLWDAKDVYKFSWYGMIIII